MTHHLDDDTIARLFTTGIRSLLQSKYELILEEAKKELEREFRKTIQVGADRVSAEVLRIYNASNPVNQLDIMIRILEVKK
jgi:chromosome condensin MukBEF complex kleisin-like MukF subunit